MKGGNKVENVIRQDIIQIEFETDETLKQIQKLQDEINDLKKKFSGGLGDDAFDDLQKEAEETVKPLKKVKEQVEKVTSKLTEMGKKGAVTAYNGLKKVAGISFKALTVGIGAAAAAIGGLVAKSVSAYAEFEQLKGGIDTLFKDSAGTILKYANNAYKTAGLSANEYMETVTSFSASLLQSLGGDTEEAAKYADMAISDMSDNANKMGTDMSSIQYAYQGFAKQNYTMLDNLKLGYGGNKTEMERLIKDAAKLDKSVKANDLSYGNIVKAIHAIQVETGIYGTTQKEAEKTVTGSLNSMKSAWGNLLTAIGSGENLDQCFDNMISTVEIFFDNIIPVAERSLEGMGTVIEKLVPKISEKLPALAEKLLPPLIKATVELTKGLIKALPTIIKTLAESIVEVFGEQFPIIQKIGDFFKDNSDTIANSIKKITPVVIGLVAAFKGFKAIKGITSLFGGGAGGGGKSSIFGGITKTFTELANTKTTTVLKGVANISIILVGLGALLWVATKVFEDGIDFKEMLQVVVLVGVLGAVGLALGKFAGDVGSIPVSKVTKGLANMAIILVGTGALLWVTTKVFKDGINFIEILKVITLIGILGIVGTVLTVFAGIVGMIPVSTVVLGLANIAIILVGTGAMLLALTKLFSDGVNFEQIFAVITLIGILGTVGTVLTVFAGIVGMIPTAVVLTGLSNIGLVLGGVTALIVAFGALSEVKGFTDFIDKGGELLVKIFNIIGEVAGALVGGLAEGITDSLPKVGENITQFANSLKPMFDVFNGADMSGIGTFFNSLGSFLLQITGNNILEFFTGETDFSSIGTQLNNFATSAKGFFVTVAGLPDNSFNNAKSFFECLAGIKSMPKEGGVTGWFTGGVSYSSLADGLSQLSSDKVVTFFNTVAGIKQEGFDKVTKFFECLAGVKSLPKDGGVVDWFTGSVDYSKLAEGLALLSGEGVTKFFTMVGGLSSQTFSNITDLFESLASVDELPKEGGWWNNLTGDETTSLSSIASDLSTFAEKTGTFFAQVNSLNIGNLNGMWDSLKNASGISSDTLSAVKKDADDIVKEVTDLPKKMGEGLKSSGSSLSTALVSIWEDAVKATSKPINKLIEGANWVLKEFGSNKKILTWTPYAKGTDGHKGGNALVNDGRGAELVQMPNGNTFIPQGRNVLIPNAPKGMKVLPADRTAQLMGKKSSTFRYARGIGDIDIWSYYDNAKGLVDKISESVNYYGMKGFILNASEGMVTTAEGAMTTWVKKLFDEEGAKSLASYVASKGVNQWRSTVIRALKMEGHYSAANVKRTLFQMQTESGGNPYAINLWDSNAKKGTPSKGLMQVIDPTFKAYARSGFNKNIYDPLSNILASVRYAVSRYGSLSKAYRGVGYENGGIVTKTGLIAEQNKPEMVIPLSESKRSRGVELWQQTGEIFGFSSYTPEQEGSYYNSNSVENNTYAPQFTININGGSNSDRELARKVKKWVAESMEDVFTSLESKNPKLREV